MSKHDEIDVIVEVEKFNPFHDSRGRFSDKHGFASYSANPNTRAGAMAIARSAAAGHGATANVHRESYGENIRQNANWIGRGKQMNSRWQGSTTLRSRVEPLGGLQGASATGASWQHQNQAQGRTTSGGKNPKTQPQQTQPQQPQQPQQPTAAKPATPKQTQAKPAQQPQQPKQAPQKPAQQPTTQKPANDRKPVDGKDISSTFRYDPRKGGDPIDQVADQQGFKGKPTVVKDRAEFSAAVKASGVMCYRTINGGRDTVTGKHKTGADFADDLKNSDTFSHNGTGGKVYGAGIYIAATKDPVKGTAPSRSATNSAKTDSQAYGHTSPKTVGMTLAANAKIGDYYKERLAFGNLSASQKAKYGNDFAAYAASKGYDGLKAKDAGWGCDYITVYNRSKLIVFDD